MTNSKFAPVLAVLALSLTAPAQAADAATPVAKNTSKYLVLTTYHLKPSATRDFEDLLKHKMLPAIKKGGGATTLYSSAPGGRADTFVLSTPFNAMSMFDDPSTLRKGAGEAEYARIVAQVSQHVQERTITIMRRRPELSNYLESAGQSPLLLVQHVKMAPGKNTEYQAMWKADVLPAVKKAGVGVSTWSVILGADNEYAMATPLSSFAELDKGISAAQMSMTPAVYDAFNLKVGSLLGNIRREVLRLRKDLMGTE